MPGSGQPTEARPGPWTARLHRVIFKADTAAGKTYDILLILTIVCSVAVVMLDSVGSVRAVYGNRLYAIEWGFTLLFTIDYAMRLWCVARPRRYARSFFGVVDILGIIPTYLSIFIPGSHVFAVIRFLRVLRLFRVLNLSSYLDESKVLMRAVRTSHRRITVFLLTVLTLVVVLGTLMYVIEGRQNGFTSIPRSIYWAIVTLTTVGYGEISPQTGAGQLLAAVIMVLGYSIIVVPTGIVTVAVAEAGRQDERRCPRCGVRGHGTDARFCRQCGTSLDNRTDGEDRRQG